MRKSSLRNLPHNGSIKTHTGRIKPNAIINAKVLTMNSLYKLKTKLDNNEKRQMKSIFPAIFLCICICIYIHICVSICIYVCVCTCIMISWPQGKRKFRIAVSEFVKKAPQVPPSKLDSSFPNQRGLLMIMIMC